MKNSKGKAIKKAKVTLKINGNIFNAKSDSEGKIIFKTKKLNKKGTFKATIKYGCSAVYNAISKIVKIKCT